MAVDNHLFVNEIDLKYSYWILRGKPFPKWVKFNSQDNQMDEGNDIDMDDINVNAFDGSDDNGEDMTEMLGDLDVAIFGMRDGEGIST